MNNDQIDILCSGGVGVIATDTLYGVVGQAQNRDTVERIYSIKKRTPTKPFIILISAIKDIELFGIEISDHMLNTVNTYWPGPVSIILDCPDHRFEYLHRGTDALAFRLPDKPELVAAIAKTGPLVAPSANPEGLLPASDITIAKNYFGSSVDFYSEGPVNTTPSKIIKLTPAGMQIIRA